VEAAKREVAEAEARLRSTQSEANESSKAVAKASDEVRAREAEATAAKSTAAGAGVMADYRQLRAMNAAMVAERLVGPGSIVTTGQKLLMLHVADPIRMQASVPQELAARIHVGSPVTIILGYGNRRAAVTSIFPQADPTTRTFTVEALIRNPGHAILPGAYASMQIETAGAERSLSVRNSAIQTDASGGKFVWVVTAKKGTGTVTDWTCPMHTQVSLHGPGKCPICSMPLIPRSRGGTMIATRKTVMAGENGGEYTAVTQGLEEGDMVIWVGFDNLVEGAAVEVTSWGSDGPLRGLAPNAPSGSSSMPGMDMSSKSSAPEQTAAPKPPAAKRTAEGKPLVKKQLWTCTMHPQVVQDHPGKCPICGMNLVPKKDAK
jgi:multidrug efflux pump subunit AcrA (membrane-fusion protein)